MEQTINNMELVLNKVESEYRNKNTQEMKTLMNTYRNLLQRFLRKPYGHASVVEHKKTLIEQQTKLDELFDKVEVSITNSLLNRDYKDADNLTMVLERIERSSVDITQLFKQRKPFVNYTTESEDNDVVALKGRPLNK